MPLYVLGLMGVTRRLSHFENPALQIWFEIAAFGALLIAAGIGCMIMQFIVSFRNRKALADTTGDLWHGRTLEWSTSSPPPEYNFAFTPVVHDRDAWWDMKRHDYQRPTADFQPIHMPRNSGTGMIIAGISVAFGFAMVWQIWWLAAISLLAMASTGIGHTFNYNRDFHIPRERVREVEEARSRQLEAA